MNAMARPSKQLRIDVAAVEVALAAGMPVKAICRALRCSRATLWRALGQGRRGGKTGGQGVLKHLSGVLKHPEPCEPPEPPANNGASTILLLQRGHP